MIKNKYSNIESIIKIAKKGGMYILVDDENRENEGDIVFCASDVSPKKINFMAKNGRGLICLTLNNNQAKKLNLNYMSPVNQSRNQTAFTVSIEAKKGINLFVKSSLSVKSKDLGISISCDGVCLTLISKKNNILEFYLSNETLFRSKFKKIVIGIK